MGSDLLAALVPDEARPIQRIRITAEEVPGGARLGGTTQEVDPQAQEWTLDFSLSIPVESTVVVTLSVELLSLSTGTPLVEWSGRAGPITLQVGAVTEIQDISLVKGPLSNLAVTGVSIGEPVPDIREGQTTQLTAVASTTTPQDPPTIFWLSLNPGVATVSGTGLVQGVSPGLARIVATAGAASDTVTVTVLQSPASVALNPDGAVLDALGAEVAFEATVLDPRGEPIPGEGVTWDVADAGILEDMGAGAFRALSRGTTTVHATSLLDPAVSGSAEVVVRQVVAAVDVIPEEAEVFIGDAVQFEAVAFDANENPIEGMTFSWSTTDPSVASVGQDGVATGVEDGTATIGAEALSSSLPTAEAGSLAPTPGTTGFATLVVLPPVARVAILPNPFTFRSLGQIQAFTARAYGLDDVGEPTKLLPLTDFTWESLNENVMTVEGTGITADTAFVRSLANGSTVLRATIRGVTGSTPVFVAQRVASVDVSPDPWVFQEAASGGYLPRTFSAEAYDQMGSVVPGTSFSWDTDGPYGGGECFPIGASTATTAEVSAQCGCGTSGAVLASAGGETGSSSISTPACAFFPGSCLASALLPGSPFRLGVRSF
jgi:uncharacterized protein YjdB